MTPTPDERIDTYLWDPAAPPAGEVTALEARLGTLRFTPDASRLAMPASPTRRRRRLVWPAYLAAAAVLVLVSGAAFVQWRLRWPTGQAWTIDARTSDAADRLAVGAPLELSETEQARIRIARIGVLQVTGDARLTLQQTGGTRHQVALQRGTVDVRVWAPPSSVRIGTPSGDVIDLGCAFTLSVDADGASRVAVRSGWVLMTNREGESLVPAGAASAMRAGHAPGVPVFTDASADFTRAVRALEAGREAASEAAETAVATIVRSARARDVLTLLLLVQRAGPGRDQFAARAADLVPPPRGVSLEAVVRGDPDAMQRWRDTLPLPAPKNWLRNWRDALPRQPFDAWR